MKTKYRINWDNGGACGTLAGEYETEKQAEEAAENWKMEMVALETTRKGRSEAEAAYQWEVIMVEDDPQTDPESAPDNPRPDWWF